MPTTIIIRVWTGCIRRQFCQYNINIDRTLSNWIKTSFCQLTETCWYYYWKTCYKIETAGAAKVRSRIAKMAQKQSKSHDVVSQYATSHPHDVTHESSREAVKLGQESSVYRWIINISLRLSFLKILIWFTWSERCIILIVLFVGTLRYGVRIG